MTVGGKTVPVLRCTGCGKPAIPPRYVCGACGGTAFGKDSLDAKATIYSYTVTRVAPEAFRADVPYSVLLVDLAPGLRVTARVAGDKGGEGLSIGQALEFDKVDDRGVYWFRVA
jgi:uncharacterized OB-fold protein